VACRKADAQTALVRVGLDGVRVVLDRPRRRPGRGAYVHATCAAALDRGKLAKSLRRSVDDRDVKRIVSDLSPTDDNLADPVVREAAFGLGAKGAKPVETAPRIKAKE
jgi:predicted RNA-binding protein YlxR (DUF448 family)